MRPPANFPLRLQPKPICAGVKAGSKSILPHATRMEEQPQMRMSREKRKNKWEGNFRHFHSIQGFLDGMRKCRMQTKFLRSGTFIEGGKSACPQNSFSPRVCPKTIHFKFFPENSFSPECLGVNCHKTTSTKNKRSQI